MIKRDRDVIRNIEAIGFEYDRTNSKNIQFFIHPDTGCEFKFVPGCDERRARTVVEQAHRLIGLPTKENKRNPAAIRERSAAEHAKAVRELEAARARVSNAVSEADIRAAEEVLLRADTKFKWWDRLMRGAA